MSKDKIVITKEEARDLALKGQRASRRLETIHFKPQTHQDKRTKRIRTRKAQKDKAMRESNER